MSVVLDSSLPSDNWAYYNSRFDAQGSSEKYGVKWRSVDLQYYDKELTCGDEALNFYSHTTWWFFYSRAKDIKTECLNAMQNSPLQYVPLHATVTAGENSIDYVTILNLEYCGPEPIDCDGATTNSAIPVTPSMSTSVALPLAAALIAKRIFGF